MFHLALAGAAGALALYADAFVWQAPAPVTNEAAPMDLTRLLETFANAVETGDGDKLADCFTEDGVYDDYFFGPSKPGRAGIRDMLAHFYEGGADFRWEFFDPAGAGPLAYASYRFSYRSTLPDAKGARVAFEGISRLQMENGKIRRYCEVFDRGMALAQLDFAPERLKKVALKYATAFKARPDVAAHHVKPAG